MKIVCLCAFWNTNIHALFVTIISSQFSRLTVGNDASGILLLINMLLLSSWAEQHLFPSLTGDRLRVRELRRFKSRPIIIRPSLALAQGRAGPKSLSVRFIYVSPRIDIEILVISMERPGFI